MLFVLLWYYQKTMGDVIWFFGNVCEHVGESGQASGAFYLIT